MEKSKNLFNEDKVVSHWLESAANDFQTMLQLYDSKSYAWALFLGHISTEKLLKALFVKRVKTHAPYTHNLLRIAEMCDFELTEEQEDIMDEITSFNINARYDDYKKEFYSRCTREFTIEWIEKIKMLQEWIRKAL